MLHSLKFEYDGRSLEVRSSVQSDAFECRVFESDQRANGVTYGATIEAIADGKDYGLDLINDLMETARDDFVRWSDEVKVAKSQ